MARRNCQSPSHSMPQNATTISACQPSQRGLTRNRHTGTDSAGAGVSMPTSVSRSRQGRDRRWLSMCQGDVMRKYVIMGIQGSGKGTQSEMLAEDLSLVHISVGDIFRWNVTNHTKMGAQVQRRLAEHDWNFGFIIDGFPRNARQAEFFLESYDIDGVIHLDLPDSEVRRRVLSRRLCGDCGMDYNLIANSPKVPGRCDMCGGELITREDDTEEALAVRLRDYHHQTNPVLEIFRRKEYVYTVDARPAPEVIQQQIRQCLGLPPYQPDHRASKVA